MTSVCDEPLVLGELELEVELEAGLDDVLEEHAPSPAARRPAAATASTRLLVNGLVVNIDFPLGILIFLSGGEALRLPGAAC
jgi:hypothetical protein